MFTPDLKQSNKFPSSIKSVESILWGLNKLDVIRSVISLSKAGLVSSLNTYVPFSNL